MFSLSSKHAVKAMLFLAKQDHDRFISAQELSELCGVPAPYLSKLMKVLARQDIIESRKGVGGGLRMNKKRVTFYDICDALDDPVVRNSCFLSKNQCQSSDPCRFHDDWLKEKKRMMTFLKSMKIEKNVRSS